MTVAVAHLGKATPRRRYQHHVAALLDEIDRRRHQLMLMRANGATRAGLAGLKSELNAVREELAAAIERR